MYLNGITGLYALAAFFDVNWSQLFLGEILGVVTLVAATVTMLTFTCINGKVFCFMLGIHMKMNITEVHVFIAGCKRKKSLILSDFAVNISGGLWPEALAYLSCSFCMC
ncbi:hypothetical protein H206_05293 [Candidatus Electrothrix aarhusensis]|uniref:Uncharacterized protein n=1 Tax=Candidatus Electrothrix aarhusensis TaxID=1859131 RepID=A0A444J503_9BACT|nr:hypothetical protein H206_05293 [Candidatus Electrothrix aarhusensis]